MKYYYKSPLGKLYCQKNANNWTLSWQGNAKVKLSPNNQLSKQLDLYFNGHHYNFCINQLVLTPFQKKVYQATMNIPFGETRSYQEIAKQAGSPGATQAVGTALKKNKTPLLIPCHRVINKSGNLGNYNGGNHYKELLINYEKEVKASQA